MTNDARGGVGTVETHSVRITLPPGGLVLESGERLHDLTVAYEAYGRLSDAKDNVVHICHALTGDAHVAGRHAGAEQAGWWDRIVGPGKGIDTDYYHVICSNILGGCRGTTGPASVNPATGRAYGSEFPRISVADIVNVQKLLMDHLGIDRLASVIGGSFGGMQALEWSIRFPDRVDSCICIAAGAALSSQALAFDLVARDAILSDPKWAGGDYYDLDDRPDWGLAHARKIGHITYLSPEIMQRKFGRQRETAENESATETYRRFEVENYLEHQGRKLVERFDANSYLRITEAMDSFDLVERHGAVDRAFRGTKSKFLVVALSSDWLFPPEQSVELANGLLRAGKRVSCCVLQAPYGHDAFLVDVEYLGDVIRAFLPWVKTGRDAARSNESPGHVGARREFKVIAGMIRPGARVLDLGCGDGSLLSFVERDNRINGFGVDIDLQNVIAVIEKGHDVFQGDIDAGLAMIPDDSYDTAVLSETLQVVRNPRFVLREMLRVAGEGIVSFPNFGNLGYRLNVLFRGRMPRGGSLPCEWHDSPNIHLCTWRDFADLCRRDGIEILEVKCVSRGTFNRLLTRLGLVNLGADRVIARLASRPGGIQENGR